MKEIDIQKRAEKFKQAYKKLIEKFQIAIIPKVELVDVKPKPSEKKKK
jgi:hypothetical protein